MKISKIICPLCNTKINSFFKMMHSSCQCRSTLLSPSNNISIEIKVNDIIYNIYYIVRDNLVELTTDFIGDVEPNNIDCIIKNYNPLNKSKEELAEFILKQLKLKVLQ